MPIFQLVSILAALLLGLIVVVRNPGDRNRWLLLLFNISICFWIASYIFADTLGDASIFWNRAVFVSSLFMAYAGYLLIASMANRLGKSVVIVGTLFLAIAAAMLTTPLVVQDISPRYSSAGAIEGIDVVRGPGYILYVASIVAAGGGLVTYVFRRARKASGRFKAQLRIIFAGFGGMLIVGLITGIVLPLILQTSAPANFSFLSAFFVMVAFAYSIVRQRLFDIRAAIARSLGYLMALVAIALFYMLVIFSLADVFFGRDASGLTVQVYYVSSALIVALTFNPVRKFFNRLTRQIFFRDTYETQEVFDELTSVLVRTVETRLITNKAGEILSRALGVEFLEIVLDDRDGKFTDLLEGLERAKLLPVITDELSHHHRQFIDRLTQLNVAYVSRLKTPQGRVGYIVCGQKRRGDVLTNQDISLMRVASDELAVAIQNALRFEEILHFNETLRTEIEEATAQLRESNRKLKKLDEAKDEFISMASHQLRRR